MRTLEELRQDLASEGATRLVFVRGNDVMRMVAGEHDVMGLQLRDGTVLVLDRLAVRLVVSKSSPGPLIPEPGTAAAEHAAGLRFRESDPPAPAVRKAGR